MIRLLLLLAALTAGQTRTCVAQLSRHEDAATLYVTGPLLPGPEVESLYREVEACTGRRGDFASLQWYSVARQVTQGPRSRTGSSWGWWHIRKDGQRMIILVAGDVTWEKEIRHEALHDILWVSGWRPNPADPDPNHPSPPFGECAALESSK